MSATFGWRSVPVVGRLLAQHTDIVAAAGQLTAVAAGGDRDAAAEQVTIVQGLLQPHADAEETGLFAILRRHPASAAQVSTLRLEHRLLDALLQDIAGGNLRAAPEFHDALRRHIDKEDTVLFPAAATLLEDGEWDRSENLTGMPERP